jgi:hypothetical protein
VTTGKEKQTRLSVLVFWIINNNSSYSFTVYQTQCQLWELSDYSFQDGYYLSQVGRKGNISSEELNNLPESPQ